MDELQLKGKTLMVVGAHPDDNDFMAAGTAAKAALLGCTVIYVMATSGDKGSNEPGMTSDKLAEIRRKEQTEAGTVLGVKEFEWLHYPDGQLEASIKLKEDIVKLIRKHRPDIMITFDPSSYYILEHNRVQHSDHRKIGEAAMDAVFPLARDRLSFPEHEEEGLKPHAVKELCFVGRKDFNTYTNISDTFSKKIEALSKHKSQLPDMSSVESRIKQWAETIGKEAGCELAEGFIRLTFRPL